MEQIVANKDDGEEEKKEDDNFVIVEKSYINDGAQEVLPLSNFSDFSRVNPKTAITDFRQKDG